MIKGILFDKDGTLLEFSSTMHYVYTKIFQALAGRYQIPEMVLQHIKDVLGYLPNRLTPNSLLRHSTNDLIADVMIESSAGNAGQQQWQPRFCRSDLLELIDELSTGDDVPYSALPKVVETLKYLKSKGYPLGVATADTHAATVVGLKKTEIFHYFDYLGTSDHAPPKPDPLLAEMFCRRFGMSAGDIVMVGDSRSDMLFAENAGAHFAGIAENSSVFMDSQHRAIGNISELIELFAL